MSLGTKLVRAVQKEAAMQRPLPMCVAAQANSHGGRSNSGQIEASVVLTDNDRFSHLAEEVKITSSKVKAQSPKATAEQLCARVTYLTEALQFVETDAAGAAIVRSTPQTMRAPRSEYFEAQVGGDAISLKRYQANKNAPGREAVPFCVTDDVLSRLVDDAAAVLSPPR